MFALGIILLTSWITDTDIREFVGLKNDDSGTPSCKNKYVLDSLRSIFVRQFGLSANGVKMKLVILI